MKFKFHSKFKPTGDQPQAIESLSKNLKAGVREQVLLGVTGSGKTFTMAHVIENLQKPALIISHNKTLAAQLYQEFKEFFPENGVHYFVSYYDYYQPEAYIPQTDTYIEKDAKINKEIDRLRHAAVQDVLNRKDVIVVASVSCIYNIGSPLAYQQVSLDIRKGQEMKRQDFLRRLISLQYQRNDIDFQPGTFRVRGNVVEVFTVTGKEVIKIEFSGDKIEQVSTSLSSTYSYIRKKFVIRRKIKLFPAHFWVTPEEKIKIAIENIKLELQGRLKFFEKKGNILEAQRLEQRTNYDLEMLEETGFCHGIENYSGHLEFRKPGDPPWTLLDYLAFSNQENNPYLVFIDESHQTIPQLRAMYNQDRARKKSLLEYGFRLPSCLDNRPLSFEEFNKKAPQITYVSATPDEYERRKALRQAQGKLLRQAQGKLLRQAQGKLTKKYIVEQLVSPTGLLEPSIEIRPIENQVQDLIAEIKKRVQKEHPEPERSSVPGSPAPSSALVRGQRVLVVTLTKRLAEELSEYLLENRIKTNYLHSEIKTLERPEILQDLRRGKYDVIVGINLLREGLDLPEVALVAILDADKEGFLRSETTLIQTMGRAARHPQGHVVLYADTITKSMKAAIKEVGRRRKIQESYNLTHNITPQPIIKQIREWPFGKPDFTKREIKEEFWFVKDKKLLEKEMKEAARNLDFERAAEIRDLIRKMEGRG